MNYVDVDFKRCVKTVSCIFFHLREKTNKCSSKMNSESSNNKNSVDVQVQGTYNFSGFVLKLKTLRGFFEIKKTHKET